MFRGSFCKRSGCAALYSDYGRVLEERNLDERAVESFKKAIAIDEDFVEAHIGLARAYTKLGDAPKAAVHIERVRALKGQ